MEDILSELYYGELNPSEERCEPNPTPKATAQKDEFCAELNDRQKELFAAVEQDWARQYNVVAYNSFSRAFKLGARLTYAIFCT